MQLCIKCRFSLTMLPLTPWTWKIVLFLNIQKCIQKCILNYWKPKKEEKKKALAHLLKVAETLLWNGPDLDKSRVKLSDLASLLWKLYQHLIWCKTQKNKLNRVCWNLWHSLFKCKWPVWPIRERVVIFEIWPCQCQIKRRN